VAIARTLAAGSDILLMDESFGALGSQRREFLQLKLRRLQIDERRTLDLRHP
jgi:NitT/TauT family transport system ATP-binding protein